MAVNDSALLSLLYATNLINPRFRSLSKCTQVSGCLVITIVWSWICITGRNLIQTKYKEMLTSELRFPVTQGLLLGRSEVRKVIILILQCFFIQAKCGKAPGCISSGKDPIWPLFKNKMKPKIDSLLDISLWLKYRRRWLTCSRTESLLLNVKFHSSSVYWHFDHYIRDTERFTVTSIRKIQ